MKTVNILFAATILCSYWTVVTAAEPRHEKAEISPSDVKDIQKGRESTTPEPQKNERPLIQDNPPQRPRPEPEPTKPEDLPPRQHPMPSPAPEINQGPLKVDPEQGVVQPKDNK